MHWYCHKPKKERKTTKENILVSQIFVTELKETAFGDVHFSVVVAVEIDCLKKKKQIKSMQRNDRCLRDLFITDRYVVMTYKVIN